MWRLPALDLVERTPEALRAEPLTVLVADPLAEPHLQRCLVDPAGILHRRADDVALLVGPDRLLHRVPRDEQPVQRVRVDNLTRAGRCARCNRRCRQTRPRSDSRSLTAP